MRNSTDQELHYMTLKHRLFGVVITTIFGCSAIVLSAQESAELEHQGTLDQTTNPSVTVEVVQNQFTKTYLQDLSKEEFKEHILKIEQYSKSDQDLLNMERLRRCSDDSEESSTDLCPEDIESTFGNVNRTNQESEAPIDALEMPQLTEENVPVSTTVPANSESDLPIGRDPRLGNRQNERRHGKAWTEKPSKPEDN